MTKEKTAQNGKCPVCGSYDLEYGDSYPQGNKLFYEFTCNNCGVSGDEQWDLTNGKTIVSEIELEQWKTRKAQSLDNIRADCQ